MPMISGGRFFLLDRSFVSLSVVMFLALHFGGKRAKELH